MVLSFLRKDGKTPVCPELCFELGYFDDEKERQKGRNHVECAGLHKEGAESRVE